jgi:hypothetical protein
VNSIAAEAATMTSDAGVTADFKFEVVSAELTHLVHGSNTGSSQTQQQQQVRVCSWGAITTGADVHRSSLQAWSVFKTLVNIEALDLVSIMYESNEPLCCTNVSTVSKELFACVHAGS